MHAGGDAAGNAKGTIVFFHPDLGIGGAERLVVDAAVGLQNLGYRVVVYTSYRDTGHCFDEARDGTLDVRVRGNVLPAMLFGRFKILLTILRHYHLLFSLWATGELRALQPTAFFLDQLSAGIPILRHLFPTVRILFYCHHPDLLLVQRRNRWYRRVWRLPFDALESWTMRGADRIVVNSKYTRSVVQGVWSGLGGGKDGIGVVYPCVDTESAGAELPRGFPRTWGGKKVVLSINRFERKKGIDLAVRAFARLDAKTRAGAKLVVAGGYDPREPENVSYHKSLVALVEESQLSSVTADGLAGAGADANVVFLLSVPGSVKETLLKSASLLVYTPTFEHFGIVPLEAMLAGVPVLASNTGGPRETVVDGETGWLRDAEQVEEWAVIMQQALEGISPAKMREMGVAGYDRVREKFSKDTMANTLAGEIEGMIEAARAQVWELQDVLLGLGLMGALSVVLSTVVAARVLPLLQ